VVGDAIFGQGNGRTFMLIEAFTVFLALIGTTLSCMNTGARVTYAMGKDKELSGGLGSLHSKNLSPHRAIWLLATISAVIGCVAVAVVFGDASAPTDATIQALPKGLFLAEHAAAGDPGLELWNFCSLYVELHHLHGGLSSPSEIQSGSAPGDSAVRLVCESGLHGVLSDWAFYGLRVEKGTALCFGRRGDLGHLWGDLLPSLEQEDWAVDAYSGAG